MSRRRRRAIDFTDSLNSFCLTETNSDTLCSISRDSLDEIKSKDNLISNDTHSNTHSIILAGHSAKHSLGEDVSMSSLTFSEVQCVPDLNERIDLFQVEQLCTKIEDDKENNNPQNNNKVGGDQNGDISKKLQKELNESSKRDSNYNIHANKSNINKLEKAIHERMSVTKGDTLSAYTKENEQIIDPGFDNKSVNNDSNKFETILCSLDNRLNRMKEVSDTHQILKRLSEQFVHAPKDFTEKLLTIIEESVINIEDDTGNMSAFALSRLTAEFRKMCKFIEDESAPEWPASPISPPAYQGQSMKSPVDNTSVKDLKTENINSPACTSVSTTPVSAIDVLRKRFFNKISKNFSGSTENAINESNNNSFERLEAQCKRLFPEEKDNSQSLHRSLSMPSLLSMSQIKNICEQQMASLSTTNMNENHKESTLLSTSNLSDSCLCQSPLINKSGLNYSKLNQLYNNSKNVLYDNISYSKKKSRRMSEKTDSSSIISDKHANGYATLDPDELEKTLLQDIAEKRKRCLDTARLIAEINEDPEALEAHKTLKMSPMYNEDNESNSLSHDETKFLKTLMSCKNYQTYLENQKPLFKFLLNSNPNTPETSFKDGNEQEVKHDEIKPSEKEFLNVPKASNVKNTTLSQNVKYYSTYKSSSTKKQHQEKKNPGESARPKLFVTPGKTPPVKTCRKKKEYFPSMHCSIKNAQEKHILKSPHAEGLYRLNYNTIISPVGMYIRGTDMQLIKNVRAKPGPLLLTPTKDNGKASPNSNSKQNTPRGIVKTQKEAPLRLNLSPKAHTYRKEVLQMKTPGSDSTSEDQFILPKVSYKLPLQVKTIKEGNSPKQGTRVKKLLEAAQNKVVIRHEGRMNSVQKQRSAAIGEVYEINYAPEDESIHVEQAASKTNFIRKRRNM